MTEPSPARTVGPVSQRPAAPDLQFTRRSEAGSSDERPVCALCGSRNQRGMRFCVTCGHLLSQKPSTAPASDGGASDQSHAATLESPSPPIAPSRVVPLGDPRPNPPAIRTCSRCRGVIEGPGQFCRFCGAPLADDPGDAGQPLGQSPPEAYPAASHLQAIGADPQVARAQSLRPAPTAPSAMVTSTVAMLTTDRSTRPRLVLIARDGGEGPTFALSETTDIGRSEGHIVVADDAYVSPRHARIVMRGGAHFLRDLGSTNGVYLRIPFSARVDGPPSAASTEPNVEQELGDQELFLVGQQVLKFEVVKHAEEGFGVASDNGTLLFGAPAASRYARLSQRTVEGVVRDVFYVRKTETVIGRESGDIVFTDDPFLSRRHAVLRVHSAPTPSKSPRRFTLADLGSSNGTFLQLREEVRLRPGDHFRIGQQLFRFDIDVNRTGA